MVTYYGRTKTPRHNMTPAVYWKHTAALQIKGSASQWVLFVMRVGVLDRIFPRLSPTKENYSAKIQPANYRRPRYTRAMMDDQRGKCGDNNSHERTRVAVLGGGLGGLTTAFHLLQNPNFEVDLYQLGWRVGGKATSGRNEVPGFGNRIEEHGLHLLFGCYDYGFQTLRQVYKNDVGKFNSLFQPHDTFDFDETIDGKLVPWPLVFPRNEMEIGRPDQRPGISQYVNITFSLLDQTIRGSSPGGVDSAPSPPSSSSSRSSSTPPPTSMSDVLKFGLRALAHALSSSTSYLPNALVNRFIEHIECKMDDVASFTASKLSSFLIEILKLLNPVLPLVWHITVVRRLIVVLWCGGFGGGIVSGAGSLDDWEYFKTLDCYDLKEYMYSKGAPELVVEHILLRVTYVMPYSWKRTVGAGTAYMFILRLLFNYKTAISFRMQAGMGEVVCVPMYKAIMATGRARVHFFHEVTGLSVGAHNEISSVHFAVQARVKGETTLPGLKTKEAATDGTDRKEGEEAPVEGNSAIYDPLILVPVKAGGVQSAGEEESMEVFPMTPKYDCLERGDELRERGIDLEDPWSYSAWSPAASKTIDVGADYDKVVLNIGVGALRKITPELMAASPTWANMVESVQTTPSSGIQLWLKKSTQELGWRTDGSTANHMIAIGAGEPFDTVADYSSTLKYEGESEAKSVIYVTGSWPLDMDFPDYDDHDFPAREKDKMTVQLRKWVESDLTQLLPGLLFEGTSDVDWDLFVDPENRTGPDRLLGQWRSVNLAPTSLYVLSAKNTVHARLPQGQVEAFPNLYLTGDWCMNLANVMAGCVEAAVSSGLGCAQSLTGESNEANIPPPKRGLAGEKESPYLSFTPYGNFIPMEPPLVCPGARVTTFIVPADYDKLVQTTASLKVGTTTMFPMLNAVILSFADFPNFVFKNGGADAFGTVAEQDVSIFVPVMVWDSSKPLGFTNMSMRLFPLYLFVNCPWAMIFGRDFYGYQKTMAETYMEPFQPGAQYFAKTKCIATKGGRADEQKIVEVIVDEEEEEQVEEGTTRQRRSSSTAHASAESFATQVPEMAQHLASQLFGTAPDASNEEIQHSWLGKVEEAASASAKEVSKANAEGRDATPAVAASSAAQQVLQFFRRLEGGSHSPGSSRSSRTPSPRRSRSASPVPPTRGRARGSTGASGNVSPQSSGSYSPRTPSSGLSPSLSRDEPWWMKMMNRLLRVGIQQVLVKQVPRVGDAGPPEKADFVAMNTATLYVNKLEGPGMVVHTDSPYTINFKDTFFPHVVADTGVALRSKGYLAVEVYAEFELDSGDVLASHHAQDQ